MERKNESFFPVKIESYKEGSYMNNDKNKARMQFLLASTGSIFTEADYQALSDHIEVHKYLINRTIPWVITWDDAAFSWMENVFSPIMQVMDQWVVRNAFPTMSLAQLYFAVSEHWYYLLQDHPEITAEAAAKDYAARNGKGLGKLLSKLSMPYRVA